MATLNTARSWLYSWGGNIPESAESAELFVSGTDAATVSSEEDASQGNLPNKAVTNPRPLVSGSDVSDPSGAAEPETMEKLPPFAHAEDTGKNLLPLNTRLQKLQQQSQTTASQKQEKTLKHKSSSASYSSYAASNWLGWTAKSSRSNSLPQQNVMEKCLENRCESARRPGIGSDVGNAEYSNVAQDAVEDSDDCSKQVVSQSNFALSEDINNRNLIGPPVNESTQNNDDDSVSETQSRSKLWGFWSLSEELPTKKEPSAHTRITNTILNLTPSLPSRKETKRKLAREATSNSTQGLQEEALDRDDAVLYKPHHSAKEFSKINTHKNENLTENVLVPEWQSCLRSQEPASHTSTSLNIHTEPGPWPLQAFDIRHWRSYLSLVSSRLGLKSSSDSPNSVANGDVAGSNTSASNTENELRFFHDQTYKLYGKSLSRLPPHKRACLPNHSKYFTNQQQVLLIRNQKEQNTQIEEDASSKNSIYVASDAAGNVLINDNDAEYQRYEPDICSRKVGPLQKISKILIIGVHGFFPTKMIRPLIGAPKGTSSKFANETEKAVIRYLMENDMMSDDESQDVSIQKIALEKEGKIFDRVDFFLEILTRWEKELNDADFVLIAAHSQGCVVSIILLAKLIKLNILKEASRKRIGILGMAGVNNGPFYGTDKSIFMKAYSAIEHESMIELFELTKFDSPQSLAYKDSMQTIIGTNVKVCFVGSVNDQLVPLYSALASHIFHPNIYRACYIDSSAKTPAFVRELISICCQLQNLGYYDNNVIKEISSILAGPLTGGGHSKIYNDGKVYDLGIKFMLDTDDLVLPQDIEATKDLSSGAALGTRVEVPLTNKIHVREYNVGKIGTNPFILPWCLRGLIFNIQKNWRPVEPADKGSKHKTASEEIQELYALFDKWKPETKALKELKFRLNGIRASKL